MNFKIPYVIYPFSVEVSIEEDDQVLRKRYKNKMDPEELEALLEDEYVAKAYMVKNGRTFIRFNQYPTAGILAHEAFHCLVFLFRRIGLELGPDSDEAWAYLLEYLVNEITSKITK